jgi:hypothetical protein
MRFGTWDVRSLYKVTLTDNSCKESNGSRRLYMLSSLLGGSQPGALPVRGCSTSHVAAMKSGQRSMVDSSRSCGPALKKRMLAVP